MLQQLEHARQSTNTHIHAHLYAFQHAWTMRLGMMRAAQPAALLRGQHSARGGLAWCKTATPARSSCSRAVSAMGSRPPAVQQDWSSWQ